MGAIGLRPMAEADWPEVEKIYRAGIETGHATFESEPPSSMEHGPLAGQWRDTILLERRSGQDGSEAR